MRAYKVTLGPHYDYAYRIMTLTQQWRYLNLTKNSFASYFLLKVSYVLQANHFYQSLRLFKWNLFTRRPITFKHRWINSITYMLITVFENSQKASLVAQIVLAGRVFETPVIGYLAEFYNLH